MRRRLTATQQVPHASPGRLIAGVFLGGTLLSVGLAAASLVLGWGSRGLIGALLLGMAAWGSGVLLMGRQRARVLAIYQAFFEHALEGIFQADREGYLLAANPALARMLGYERPEQLRGIHLPTQVLADAADFQHLLPQLQEHGAVSNYCLQLRRRSGEVFWARMNIWTQQDLLEGTLEDISEWQQAEAAFRASEARYRTLLEHLPVGVYRSTPDGTIRAANTAIARMLGYDAVEDLLQANARTFYVDPKQREAFLEWLREKGEAVAELALRRLDGAVIWVQDHARCIVEKDGQVYFDGVLIDITERKEAEQALQESERRYQQLLEQLPEPVVVHDGKTILYANAAAATFAGLAKPEELIGKSIYQFLQTEKAEAIRRYLELATQRGQQLPVAELQLIRADGAVREVELISAPVQYQGRPAFQVVLRDITERKQYERQLLEAKERAEEIARLKSTLLSNISHEIRTPLAGIIGFAEVLEEELDDPHRELASLIRDSGRRLLETLNTLLDLARIEAGAFMLTPEPFDAVDEVRQSVRIFQNMIENKGLKLVLDVPDEPVPVYLDRNGFHRIVINLVSNAVKFTDQGMIRVALAARGDQLQLQVQDTGVGIDPAFLPHIFEEFRQEHDGLTRSHRGSGLGLAITHRLIEMMGGRIEVTSEKGKGSTFTVWLPLRLTNGTRSESPSAAANSTKSND
ncbi:PAS domain-containing sensor histidine kinase [Rhodothermus profundi]|uniref:histidine kinase n=1 Tax=Rhodothermus profundi TaxID=633813 RepID=A0A1M6TW06_9BACT|nr:PAS domain-containing sensor histidine kinase [Rhodothermus profundi]SHK61074.1 PAS domain S-box-containing protein [Rhodothermus profundi]